jgi:hypothetical protein
MTATKLHQPRSDRYGNGPGADETENKPEPIFMSKASTTTKLASAGLAIAILAVLTPQPAAAYQCKHIVTTATGTAKLIKGTAQASAKAAWTAKVKSRLGLPWSVWNIAKNASISCSKAGNKWHCAAKAKPCTYVVN